LKREESISKEMFTALKEASLTFFMGVPCKYLADLISHLEQDRDVVYVPVTREEEGIGIAAGGFLAGKLGVLLMQNSGLGNSINTLASLMLFFRIPVVLLVSQRGLSGETIDAQIPMGRATEQLLKNLDIPFFTYSRREDLVHLKDHVFYARSKEKPVALLVHPEFWG
jgi:sulfopyruvate decarboxylase subunit alpha